MPKEQPKDRSSVWKRRISREIGILALGIMIVGILVWIYVVSSGIRDLRRHTNAIDRAIDQQEIRLDQLEDQVQRFRL
ncbi:hypothetical protein A3D72_00445 [Candidatus Uhrbacteria bacterium RIFCSPHIGHO2_02_FULL_57_19]|uniref:Uncharacterized protein n=1 Tax=Candidatus Uhrbacteria bacterium RIFCSPHIGHO2_02_FULL_57_19 TaxID=1802391 RepID=A0A1F7U678_9BACT|nr:MAG: hypothetical protein A3D72_00445 [Candidatus Uhrbacteria bacterium RIFCSPHIGHO2_02_FULL_57_19]